VISEDIREAIPHFQPSRLAPFQLLQSQLHAMNLLEGRGEKALISMGHMNSSPGKMGISW
jgi:hypothetical protein